MASFPTITLCHAQTTLYGAALYWCSNTVLCGTPTCPLKIAAKSTDSTQRRPRGMYDAAGSSNIHHCIDSENYVAEAQPQALCTSGFAFKLNRQRETRECIRKLLGNGMLSASKFVFKL
eukprot:2059779-Rhodomonas_salina.1